MREVVCWAFAPASEVQRRAAERALSSERVGGTLGASTPRSPDTVNVLLCAGHVVVDDMVLSICTERRTCALYSLSRRRRVESTRGTAGDALRQQRLLGERDRWD
jgi:hypothetical protein